MFPSVMLRAGCSLVPLVPVQNPSILKGRKFGHVLQNSVSVGVFHRYGHTVWLLVAVLPMRPPSLTHTGAVTCPPNSPAERSVEPRVWPPESAPETQTRGHRCEGPAWGGSDPRVLGGSVRPRHGPRPSGHRPSGRAFPSRDPALHAGRLTVVGT